MKGRDYGSAAEGRRWARTRCWETFWNIRARRPLTYPPASFGPAAMDLVGLTTGPAATAVKDLKGKWFETIKPEELEPRDLHPAQLDRRLGKKVAAHRSALGGRRGGDAHGRQERIPVRRATLIRLRPA